MNVSLTQELERFVHDRVKTGRYHSASEVVREGLRLLESREQLRELQLDEMRRRLVIGSEVARPEGPGPAATEEPRGRFRRFPSGSVAPAGEGRAASG